MGVIALLLGLAASIRAPGLSTLLPTTAIAAAIAGAAAGCRLSLLRVLEVLLFGGISALIIGIGLRAGGAADPASMWRDAALASSVLVLAYGVLVPNAVPRAAIGVGLLAAVPPLLLAALASRSPAAYEEIVAVGVTGPLIILGVACVIAMAGGALNGLFTRIATDAREADMYTLLEKVGAGGMGEIWRAKHQRLSRTAAIKIIRPDRIGDDPKKANDAICRFELEAKSTARLRSPNTVEVYDYGTTRDGTFYYVMEYLNGLDLRQLVERFGPLRSDRVVFLMEQVCQSLCDAHEHGLIHRDIKPANIFVSQLGSAHDHVKVLDFGLARPIERGPEDTAISKSNELLGTPAYMAPELITGKHDVDIRADLYAIGCVAYFALTGEMVFEAENAITAAIAHATETPEPPSQRTSNPIPADLEGIIMRCLEKAPEDRYEDCHALGTALRACESWGSWNPETARVWWRESDMRRPPADDEAFASTQLG